MRTTIRWRLAVAGLLLCRCALAADAPPPAWAYPVPTPGLAAPRDDGSLLHVPASNAGYTRAQLDDLFAAPDWHPDDHPPMPDVVAHGRRPDVHACGYCHRPDGSGGPENARLAGLPYGYILQQLADFRSGARRSALPARVPQALMVAGARALSEDDARAAAAYFSTLKPRRAARVQESATVPRTVAPGWYLAAVPGSAEPGNLQAGTAEPGITEPIGQRIIEVPEHREDFERRDPRAAIVAYVPPGSVRKGAAIVSGAAPGKTPPCATCHGAGLHGQGNVPGIAGRSPSYIVRQLYDLRTGARAGQAVQVMRGLLARLDDDDVIAVAAYLASIEP